MQIKSKPGAAFAQSSAGPSITGTLTETTLATVTVPAGTIGANGQIEIIALWSHTNNANNKTLRVKIGTSVLLLVAVTTTNATQSYTRFANRNSQAAQVLHPVGTLNAFASVGTAHSTLTEDTAVDKNITFTAQLANVADSIGLESFIINVYPKT